MRLGDVEEDSTVVGFVEGVHLADLLKLLLLV